MILLNFMDFERQNGLSGEFRFSYSKFVLSRVTVTFFQDLTQRHGVNGEHGG